ncbi:MAG: ATP-dependent 6-phosphofructokinase, partial [Moorella sp. (in: Bacteria)]|nr:ATP-dependent 6-phosphofructokinase [Moorella sp. (in: firmicutes)]
RMVGIAANQLVDRDLEAVLEEKKGIDPGLFRLADVLAL